MELLNVLYEQYKFRKHKRAVERTPFLKMKATYQWVCVCVCEKAKLIRGDPPKIALKRRESPLKIEKPKERWNARPNFEKNCQKIFLSKIFNIFVIYTKSYLNTQIFKKVVKEFTKLGFIAGSTLPKAKKWYFSNFVSGTKSEFRIFEG